MPIATNLTLILVIINATIKVSTDLLGGDKLKFITQMCLKTGFMLFLIHNWFGGTGLNLMGSLGEAFQDIGFAASGITNGTLQPNDIVNNGMKMFTTVWAKMSLSIMHPVASLVELLMATALIIIIFLTALEMFMARVEFYTMALITIPLIPFGAIDQLKFLWEKALGAMFNLAVKLCVICFLQGVTTKALGDYCTSLADTADAGKTIDMTILIQGLLMTVMFYFLVKKVPELVQGLLSGNPSLNGGSMMQTARDVGGKAATATAAVATGGTSMAGAAAKGMVAGAKQGAVAGFHSAGGGQSGLAMGAFKGAVGGLKGGLDKGAGAMTSGIKTLAEAGLLGQKNDSNGGKGGVSDRNRRTGGLLSGAYNAVQMGKELAGGFDNRATDENGKKTGEHKGIAGQVVSSGRGAINTAKNVRGAASSTINTVKKAKDFISQELKK